MKTQRIPDYPIDSLFINRWSPRAYDNSQMPPSDLLSTLEAARWAPSAFNIQPWRFLYSLRDDPHWQTYLTLLDPFNANWASSASALVFVMSDSQITRGNGKGDKPSRTHSFDTGAAWGYLALQATSMGYQAHAMAGIHYEQTRQTLDIPERFRIEIAIAIGKRANADQLPEDLRERETPSQRFSVHDIAFAGGFPK